MLPKIRACNCAKKPPEDSVAAASVLTALLFAVGAILLGSTGGVRFTFIFATRTVELKSEHDLRRSTHQ
ncbi:Uncharacterised protein [Vibrio cholerae]|nr:Uncharacterised protein [Vibrio cholerae]CSH89230.1 Uncharacterised protein [Vibrio cholerae]